MRTEHEDKGLKSEALTKDEIATLKQVAAHAKSKEAGEWPKVLKVTEGTIAPSGKIVVPQTAEHIAAEAAHEAAKAELVALQLKVYQQEQAAMKDPEYQMVLGHRYVAPAQAALDDAEAIEVMTRRQLSREQVRHKARWDQEWRKQNGVPERSLRTVAKQVWNEGLAKLVTVMVRDV